MERLSRRGSRRRSPSAGSERSAAAASTAATATTAAGAQYVMEWEGVSKRYPGADALALDDVSFSVRPGEIVVLVGPNGSGKTTAMEMVSGLRLPTAGKVRVAGREVRPSGE